MTLPAILYAHKHISEREGAHRWPDGRYDDGAWEDCTWVSAVEFARLTIRHSIPATHDEAEALRNASGEPPLGGSNESDMMRGVSKRYGKALTPLYGWAALWNALKPGTAAVVAGSMGAFSDGHTLRRFDPSFAGRHRVMVARFDNSDVVWWCDPLAPVGTYVGQGVTKSGLYKFVTALQAANFVGVIIPKPVVVTTQEVEVQAPVTDETAKLMDVPAGATLYELDGVKVIKKLINSYPGRPSPYAAGKRAMHVTINSVKRIALVSPVSNIRAVPDPTPYSQAQLDAAKAVATTEATKTEKSRVRTLLGL